MITNVLFSFLLYQICDATASQGRPNNTERYNASPNETIQYKPKDGSVTLQVQPADFCGDEILSNVSQRDNPERLYSPSLDEYLAELREANVYERKAMVLVNLENTLDKLGKIPPSCPRAEKRDLQVRAGGRHTYVYLLSVVTTVTSFGIAFTTIASSGDLPATLKPFIHTAAFYVCFFVLQPFIYAIYSAFERILPQDLLNLSEWQIVAITMLLQATNALTLIFAGLDMVADFALPPNVASNLITSGRKRGEPSCLRLDSNDRDSFLTNTLPYLHGGEKLPLRPYSLTENGPGPKTCQNTAVP